MRTRSWWRRALARLPQVLMSHQRRVRLREVSRKIQPQPRPSQTLIDASGPSVRRSAAERAMGQSTESSALPPWAQQSRNQFSYRARGAVDRCKSWLTSPPFPLSIQWRGGRGRGHAHAPPSPPRSPLSIGWRGGQGERLSASVAATIFAKLTDFRIYVSSEPPHAPDRTPALQDAPYPPSQTDC